MKQSNKIVTIIVVLIIIVGSFWYMNQKGSTREETPTTATTTTSNPTTTKPTPGAVSAGTTKPTGTTVLPPAKKLETYTNGVYKFTVSYPSEYQARPFVTFYQLNNVDWRFAATTAKRGIPVISVPVFRIDQGSIIKGKKYPLYFTAEVRVGVSLDTAQCYSPDDGYANQKISSVIIGGVTFKKFDFGDAAMMKYVNGSSYRTVHGNMCYVIEQIRNGTTYKDDTMIPGYTDKELDAFYNKTTAIVYSFRFLK